MSGMLEKREIIRILTDPEAMRRELDRPLPTTESLIKKLHVVYKALPKSFRAGLVEMRGLSDPIVVAKAKELTSR